MAHKEPKKGPGFRSKAKQQLESLIQSDNFGKKKSSSENTTWETQTGPHYRTTSSNSSKAVDRVLVRGKFSSNGDLREDLQDWNNQPEFFETSSTLETESDELSTYSQATTTTAFLGDFIYDEFSSLDSEEDIYARHPDTCEYCREANEKARQEQEAAAATQFSTVVYFSTLLMKSQFSSRVCKRMERSISCQTLVDPVPEPEKDIASPSINGYVQLAFF